MTIRTVYFSGTGCTAMVARQFEAEFRARGHKVQMQRLHHDEPIPEGHYDLLLLCFAVHAGGAPVPVLDWLKSLKRCKEIPAAVVSVSGGGELTPNLACRVRSKRLLRHKGFDVFHERMIIMPSNWMVPTPPALIAPILNVMPSKAAFTACEILEGKRNHIRAGIGNRIIEVMGRVEHGGARRFGRNIRVRDNCTGYGLCAKLCPVGNIKMDDGRPSYDEICLMCMACLYSCPAEALYPTRIPTAYISGGFNLKKMINENKVDPALNLEKETQRLLWRGVRRYLRNTEDMREPESAAQSMSLEETDQF